MNGGPELIRNVCLIGHRGSGKTSLGEAMLGLASGRSGRAGRVLDFAEDESERGMTLGLSVASCEWKGRRVNIIDTPGDGGFIGDAFIAQRVADCAILVVHAQDPVQVVTERVWRRGEREDIPHFVVVNHLDRERADYGSVVEALRERFGPEVVPVNLPIGREDGFSGVYGLLTDTAFDYTTGEQSQGPPAGMEEEIDAAKVRLFEAIAESDDTLLEKYLEGEELTKEDTFEGIRKGIVEGLIIPVAAASAERMVGVDRILDLIAGSAPSPVDRSRWVTEGGDPVPCDPDGPFAAYVFKTYIDPQAGRLSVMRVVSGTCRSDETLVNPRTGANERLGSISHLYGRDRSGASEAVAGDIVAAPKLKDTATLDTLSRPESPLVFERVELPEPTTSVAIGATRPGDEEKVFEAIRRVTDEDPSLKLERVEATGEEVLSGLSQMHVELALERVHRRYNVEVASRPPKVPFMETISASASAQGRHKKQSGGRGQFGDARIDVEPLPRGSGFEFEDAIVGGAIPRQFIPAVEKGIVEAMQSGPIAGYPVVDVKVRLHDGAYHSVDSSEAAFKVAGSLAFKNACEEARPVLLEPYVKVEVLAPTELVGDIMGDLSGRRGRPMGMEQRGERQVIQAEVPQVEMLTYARDLRSLSGGRANFHVEFDHYEEVPPNLVEKVLAANEREEEVQKV
ncbi:Translation elongation factors (GTPases) [Rubrobacter radiotolerans]|uniref:Elongation factor G n=1 Tax=Rubrobacter radiotolerans TaxID=42256 RepID=A0A023WZX3_RUBRA|nr:elongation factor G [Rubrobacter radiotolerans]AHY45782.1 Translation elongation factors (GTPases) [Rubrobacter radiotolerans]MDX5893197.1 elongation factor G [Rubrobacter radiotolerans]SMC03247.1 translation elongation factor 2 (EF-2/EF-G) [Rubrobacter radiotolerans DSM 5868]